MQPSVHASGVCATAENGQPITVATISRLIRAEPDDVWAVLADPETYPDWLVGAVHIRAVDDRFPEPGSEFHHEVGAGGPATVPDRTTALDAEPARSLALFVRARPLFEGVVRFELRPTPDGTSVRMEEEPCGALRRVAPVLAPVLVARNAWSLARLRRLVEGRGSAAG